HGTASLLQAVARLLGDARDGASTPHLLIVGEGPERPALEALASDLGIGPSTTFTGAIPHEEVPGYLAAMDIAVAPYDERTDFYFSPLKLFEYMAASRPVVAADIGQIRDCVRHGETGLLYPPGDVVGLADALAVLIDDSQLAATIGRAGQEGVQAHHTWEGNARAVAAVASALPGPAGKER
ncbi:MAG: glycosyltransferase, partial [Chloroflexota bacterium]|nr:glycosyltransferase [Chloroflexota bacterium]